jgi:signal transduction histidine kinase
MLLNKKIFFFIILGFFVFSATEILYFSSNINKSFELFQINKQKEVVKLALSYNKTLYDNGLLSKDQLLTEYEFINKQQAYIALLDFYKSRIKQNIIFSTIILSIFLMLIIIALLNFFLRQYLYPLQQVIITLNNYIKNGKVKNVVLKGSSEIKEFLNNFNMIMDKLVLSRVEEKIKTSFQNWQTLARILVHEIKNQISPLYLNIEYLIYYKKESETIKYLENIKTNLGSVEKIVNNFKNLSNLPEPVCQNVQISDIIKDVIFKLNFTENIYKIYGGENIFNVFSDRFYLDLIFVNLLKNAKEACLPENVFVEVYLENDFKKVIIKDHGTGISDNILPKIFNPGFTTKETGDGIGLFLVKELCGCLGIKISVESVKDSGTSFILEFNNE